MAVKKLGTKFGSTQDWVGVMTGLVEYVVTFLPQM
jgi:hypothetical protein